MSKGGAKLQRILKGIFKTLVFLIFGIIGIISLLFLLSRSPAVQTYLINLITNELKEEFNLDVEIDHFYLSGFKSIDLEHVLIRDNKNDTLIYVGELEAEVSLPGLLNQNTLELSQVNLKEPQVHLRRYLGDSTMNINYFIAKLSRNQSSGETGKANFKIITDGVNLSSGIFKLKLESDTSDYNGRFNPGDFRFDQINLRLDQFQIFGDTIESYIQFLNLIDAGSNEKVEFKESELHLHNGRIQFNEIYLKYANTEIADSLILSANNWDEWTDFEENVFIQANLKNSEIDMKDISYFILLNFETKPHIIFSSSLSGTLNSIRLSDFSISYQNSFISGNASFDGLPNLENTIMALDIHHSEFNYIDFKSFVPEQFHSTLKNIDKLNLKGNFDGFYYDFVADGEFKTRLGRVITDINLKIPDEGKAKYSGNLKTRNFQLGKLIQREKLFQAINLDASLNGSGLQVDNADLVMNASLRNSGIYGHKYDTIRFNARLKEYLFDGQLDVLDSAIKIKVSGLLNLNKESEKIDLNGQVYYADLDQINLSEKHAFLRTKFDMDFNGLSPDQSSGYGNIKDLEIIYDEKYLFMDTLGLVSKLVDSIRNIDINSDFFDAHLSGNFTLKRLLKDLQNLVYEYQLQLINDKENINTYYAQKEKNQDKYKAKWNFEFKNINPISSLFFPELFISHGIEVNGEILMGKTEIFNVYTNIDTIIYEKYQFFDNEIDLSSSKYSDSSNILAFVLIDSKDQKVGEDFEGQDLRFETLWNKRDINFTSGFYQKDSENLIRFSGHTIFERDSTVITFDDSQFKIFESDWGINPESEIRIAQKEIAFQNFVLKSEYESIEIKGGISENPKKELQVNIKDFNIRNINPIINRNISGVLNTELSILNIYNDVKVYGDLKANDCTLEGFLVGDIQGRSSWDKDINGVILNYSINRLGSDIMKIRGQLKNEKDEINLNLTAILNNTKLNILEPFTEDVMSNIRGNASGNLYLSGTSSQPILKGNVLVENGQFTVDYLKTTYSFSDRLVFDTDNILTNNLELTDENGNKAILNGGIYHNSFQNIVIDMDAQFNDFLVLNTNAKDNSLYYGKAIGTGKLNFLGSFNDIAITGDLTSNKGTNVHIPLDNFTQLEKESHITFISEMKEEQNKGNVYDNKVDLSGLSMNFNLTLTPDAKIEIILDRQTGDIIKGTGNGELSLEIDTRGEFNMYGFYEINKGSYNFTLLNIVNKEFNIKPGGTISWAGDPYQGQLDLTGSYQQNVSLKPLMVSADSIFYYSPQAARRHPVTVNLKLTGPLLSPDFEFGIGIKDPPVYQGYDFNNDLLAFQNRIQNDEDFLNRQVFSLIVLRQFSQNQASIQEPAGKNLSELFTNQLSNYLSSVDENLEINFDLSGLSQEDLNDLQLRLSYSFLDGRLRVTREGGFTNATNDTDVSSIIGDWTIEYALTDDGRLKAKMFNRNNQNVYQPGNQSTNTTGISVLYTKSFDEFIEFLDREERKAPIDQKKKKDSSKKGMIREEDFKESKE